MTIIEYNPGDDKTYVGYINTEGAFIRDMGYYFNTHPKADCEGRPCCIHSPSIHPLMTAPLNWDESIAVMYRMCPDGVLHEDPDDVAYRMSAGRLPRSHFCDGCCHE